jgi:hypothetical protein
MNFLPNSRWLCISSSHFGFDWQELSKQIDVCIEGLGLDLVQEDVYLFFNLDGNEGCVIGRPVSGFKKDLKSPFTFMDWTTRPVTLVNVVGKNLEDYLSCAKEMRTSLELQGRTFNNSFILRIRRQLNPALTVTIEAIFYE